MEEELNYSTVVFKNGGRPPREKIEDSTIYATIACKAAASTVPKADGEQAAHSRRFGLLAGCLGLLCVLLVACISAIIYISIKMNKEETNYKANLNSLTSENHQLAMEKSLLEQESEELSRDRDDLNWTLSVILKFNNFPANEFCPDKKCQPCQKGWIQFQDKCYLFYNRSPWMTWQRSQNQCKNVAADLVVIDSQQEQEFIKKHIESYYDRFHGYWIGLKQNDNQDWIWVDGHNDTLGYWIGQTLGPDGSCALMIPDRKPTASWDPANCPMYNKFICETEVLTRSIIH